MRAIALIFSVFALGAVIASAGETDHGLVAQRTSARLAKRLGVNKVKPFKGCDKALPLKSEWTGRFAGNMAVFTTALTYQAPGQPVMNFYDLILAGLPADGTSEVELHRDIWVQSTSTLIGMSESTIRNANSDPATPTKNQWLQKQGVTLKGLTKAAGQFDAMKTCAEQFFNEHVFAVNQRLNSNNPLSFFENFRTLISGTIEQPLGSNAPAPGQSYYDNEPATGNRYYDFEQVRQWDWAEGYYTRCARAKDVQAGTTLATCDTSGSDFGGAPKHTNWLITRHLSGSERRGKFGVNVDKVQWMTGKDYYAVPFTVHYHPYNQAHTDVQPPLSESGGTEVQYLSFAARECHVLKLKDATPMVFTAQMGGCNAYVLAKPDNSAPPIFIHCNANGITNPTYPDTNPIPDSAGEHAKDAAADMIFARYHRRGFVRHVANKRIHYGPTSAHPNSGAVATWGLRSTTRNHWRWFSDYVHDNNPASNPSHIHTEINHNNNLNVHAWTRKPHHFGNFECADRPPTDLEYSGITRVPAFATATLDRNIAFALRGGATQYAGWKASDAVLGRLKAVLGKIKTGLEGNAWDVPTRIVHEDLRHCIGMYIMAVQFPVK